VFVTISALVVMPGRSALGGLVMPILISNSVFCSLVPEAADLRHDALERLREQGVGLDLGRLAGANGDDVVLVDIDLRFHPREIGDHQDDIRLELGAEGDLALLLVQFAHGPGHRRVDRGLGQVVPRLLERSARLLHLPDRGLEARFLDLPGGLLGVELRLRLELARLQFLGARELLLRPVQVLAHERGVRLRGTHVRLCALHGREIALPIQPYEERALLDPLPFDDAELLDLRAHVRADLDLGLGLNLAGRADLLNDLLPAHLGRLDLEPLVLAPARGDSHRHADHDHERHASP
jgi:hypothetical protein